MTQPHDIAEHLADVRSRVARAVRQAGQKPEDVTLVGVAKRQPVEAVVAAVRAGLCDLGENYLQEAEAKIPAVHGALDASGRPRPRWHFVGRLQRNKARKAVHQFDRIHTVDREALARELDRHASDRRAPLEVLLQVNLSDEGQKGGIAPDGVRALLASCAALRHLRVVGLMTLPAPTPDPEATRPAFAALRALRDELRQAPGGEGLRELSMGMSADFEVAIQEGASIVRIGTAIFGPRED